MSKSSTEHGAHGIVAPRSVTAVGEYKVVSLRLRSVEFEALLSQVQARGLTINMALRIAARRISGFLETDEETRRDLRQITEGIGEIANALNEIRSSAIRDGRFDAGAFSKQRTAWGAEFGKLDGLLQTILNVSKRRKDGQKLLERTTK